MSHYLSVSAGKFLLHNEREPADVCLSELLDQRHGHLPGVLLFIFMAPHSHTLQDVCHTIFAIKAYSLIPRFEIFQFIQCGKIFPIESPATVVHIQNSGRFVFR